MTVRVDTSTGTTISTTAPVVAARCLLCGGGHQRNRFAGAELMTCASCDFTWTSRELAVPAELYDENYFRTAGYRDYLGSTRQRRFEARRRLRWLLSVVRPVSLVEAGSAGGFFVAAARAAGIDAVGVEVSEAASLFARERLGVPVRQGCFEEWVPERLVDVVCAFHVLEHVADPRVFLRAVRGALVPGGWLALEVPNIASAAARRLGPDWPGIAPNYHRWHFTPKTLTRLLAQNGFHVVARDTVFSRFYWRPLRRALHVRELLLADWAASRSLRVSHLHRGDLLRVVARLTPTRTSSPAVATDPTGPAALTWPGGPLTPADHVPTYGSATAVGRTAAHRAAVAGRTRTSRRVVAGRTGTSRAVVSRHPTRGVRR